MHPHIASVSNFKEYSQFDKLELKIIVLLELPDKLIPILPLAAEVMPCMLQSIKTNLLSTAEIAVKLSLKMHNLIK